MIQNLLESKVQTYLTIYLSFFLSHVGLILFSSILYRLSWHMSACKSGSNQNLNGKLPANASPKVIHKLF